MHTQKLIMIYHLKKLYMSSFYPKFKDKSSNELSIFGGVRTAILSKNLNSIMFLVGVGLHFYQNHLVSFYYFLILVSSLHDVF